MIKPKCEKCGVELDTKTNRARDSYGYWLYMCKDCYDNWFMPPIREYARKQKELETGVGF